MLLDNTEYIPPTSLLLPNTGFNAHRLCKSLPHGCDTFTLSGLNITFVSWGYLGIRKHTGVKAIPCTRKWHNFFSFGGGGGSFQFGAPFGTWHLLMLKTYGDIMKEWVLKGRKCGLIVFISNGCQPGVTLESLDKVSSTLNSRTRNYSHFVYTHKNVKFWKKIWRVTSYQASLDILPIQANKTRDMEE